MPGPWGDLDLELALRTAREAVQAGGDAALAHWSETVAFERKGDGSPVTAGDRASEAAIVQVIRARFPEHSLLAEESGVHAGDPNVRWIVDPLDGTKGFTRGGFFWGPLVALEAGGEIVAGACALPALGRSYWATRGLGAFGAFPRGGERRLRVSERSDWSESTLALGELRRLLDAHGAAVQRLARTAGSVRCYGDAASCALLLEGRAEAWIEFGVQPWDVAPFQVLIEEAGGRFGDFAGGRSIAHGNAIGSNGHVHALIEEAFGIAG